MLCAFFQDVCFVRSTQILILSLLYYYIIYRCTFVHDSELNYIISLAFTINYLARTIFGGSDVSR